MDVIPLLLIELSIILIRHVFLGEIDNWYGFWFPDNSLAVVEGDAVFVLFLRILRAEDTLKHQDL